MPNQSYFPVQEGNQVIWFKNIQTKLPGYTTLLSIPPAEATATQSDLAYLIVLWESWLPAWRQYAEAATAYRDLIAEGEGEDPVPPPPVPQFDEFTPVAPGALTRLFKSIARWKTAPGYTESIGQDLRIIGPEVPDGPTAPEPKGKVVGGVPQFTFIKAGHKGVYIESERQGEPGWVFLAIATEKPYLDPRPVKTPGQAEWREYRMKFWDGAPGLPAGDWSDTLRLTAEG